MLLTFIETAHPIELSWNETDIDDAFALERMTIEPFKVYPPLVGAAEWSIPVGCRASSSATAWS